MSFEAVIGRIDQIIQLQQQVQDPAAVAATSTAATGGVGLSGAADSSSSTSPSFATALADAQAGSPTSQLTGANPSTGATDPAAIDVSNALESGTNPLLGQLSSLGSAGTSGVANTSGLGALASLGGISSGGSTAASDPRVQAMVQEADSLVGKPYVWGGGHAGFGAQSGYDCSGFVSAVLHAGGYLSSPQDTTSLPGAPGIEQGPGQSVTIYDRNASGQEGHVIIQIDGQFYESGGEAGSWGGGGGVEKIATPSASYLATFNDVLHPAGL